MSTKSETVICSVYRCSKKEGMYIYVAKDKGLDALPEALVSTTGRTELAMTLVLTPDKKLARAKAEDVLAAIKEQGFYLQMPPVASSEAQASTQVINEANHFLER